MKPTKPTMGMTGRMSTQDLDDSASNNPLMDEPHKPKRPFEVEDQNWMKQSKLAGITDREVVNAFKLDESLIGNKKINTAALNAAFSLSIEGYKHQGYSKSDAKDLAKIDREIALQQIKQAEEMTGKKFL